MRRILFPLIFGLTGTAILLGLGVWQLQRMVWKQAVIAEIDSRISAPPVALPETPDPVRDKYLPVIVRGTILPSELRVLVSVRPIGPGYRLIAPFELENGRRIMIDRGFVPMVDKDKPRIGGPAEIVGNLHWPQEVDMFIPDPDLAANVWFARDVPVMAAALGAEPVLLIAKTRTDPDVMPLPVNTARISNNHLQYAATWFSLAVIWIAMSAYMLWRGRAAAQTVAES